MLFQFTELGDLLVMGLSILEIDNDYIKLEQQLVKESLRHLLNRHPMLRAHVEQDVAVDGQRLVYLNIANVEDDSQIEKLKITDEDLVWKEINSRDELISHLEAFNSVKFDYTKKCKLWKAAVFEFTESNTRKYAIAIQLPLYLTDALNITTLSIEIVNIINALCLCIPCEEMKTQLDCVDDLYTIASRENIISERQFKQIDDINRKTNRKRFNFDQFLKKSPQIGCRLNMFHLDKCTTHILISLCKQKNVKFTGFLNACLFYAIKDLYDENCLEMPAEVAFGVTANLRIRFRKKVDFSEMGFFSALTLIETEYPHFGRYKDIWADAKYLDQLIGEATDVKSGALFAELYNFESVNHINSLLESGSNLALLKSYAVTDVCTSNAGTYVSTQKKQNPMRPFEIKELYFTDSVRSENPIDIFLNHVLCWNDQLHFMISSNKSAIDSDYADRLVCLLEKRLNDLSKICSRN